MKLHKSVRLLQLLLIVLVLSYFIPEYYWMKFEQNIRPPFIQYSCELHDFLLVDYSSSAPEYIDRKGNIYSRTQYERLVPLQNFRQLSWTGTFPDSLKGVRLDLKTVAKNNISFRLKPEVIDAPQIQLFPLFESESGRLKLESPDIYFRIKDRIEFINASSNTVNGEISSRFNSKLGGAGFTFPARVIAGNPSDRKPFDEGYFIVDASHKLYHLKMKKGQPFLKYVPLPAEFKIRFIQVMENELKEYYGILLSENNEIYLITYDNYRLQKLPVENFDPGSSSIVFMGDLFNRTISVVNDSSVTTVATDRNYNVVARYRQAWPTNEQMPQGRIASILMPFRLTFFKNSNYVDFNFRHSGVSAVWGLAAFFLCGIAFTWFRYKNLKNNWTDLLIVLLSGLYGLIAIILIKNDELQISRTDNEK